MIGICGSGVKLLSLNACPDNFAMLDCVSTVMKEELSQNEDIVFQRQNRKVQLAGRRMLNTLRCHIDRRTICISLLITLLSLFLWLMTLLDIWAKLSA